MRDLLPALDRWLSQREEIAIATLVRVRGSAPRTAGARLGVTRSGKMAGSVSGGCVEADVSERARQVLDSGQPVVAHYAVADDAGLGVGLSCGGAIDVLIEPFRAGPPWQALRRAIEEQRPAALAVGLTPPDLLGRTLVVLGDATVGSLAAAVEAEVAAAARNLLADTNTTRTAILALSDAGADATVFIEAFPPQPRLYLVGATHIAVALCRMAAALDYRVTVIDPRAAYATAERFPDAAAIVQAWPEDALAGAALDAYAYVVTLTHDRKFDIPTLTRALRSTARYVGALGSRATTARRAEELRQRGVSDTELSRLHAPIGLDLGAGTPEEIAVAILAEMLAVRYGRDGGFLRGTAGHAHR